MTPLDLALHYIERGWSPIPVPFRSKRPEGDAWQTRVIDAAAAPQYFDGGPSNIGVLLGPSSHGLTDVDLDCAEAIAIAPYILPRTRAIFGRASKRASHWLYYTDLAVTAGKAVQKFTDPKTKQMLVELRIGGAKGAQTIFPGSTHEDGEPITWEENGEPASADDLDEHVRTLAAFTLLARGWPQGRSTRHGLALVIGGFLARNGASPAEAKLAVEAIAKAAADEEWRDRAKAAEDAVNASRKGNNSYGFPACAEAFGKEVAVKVAEWLGYSRGNGTQAPRAESAEEPTTQPDTDAGVSLNDFHAYMPQAGYIFVPSRDLWPASSVNARVLPVIGPDGKPIAPSKWLASNRAVEQMTWAPGEPQLIKGRLISEGGWIRRPGCTVFNLYRPPVITARAGDVSPWLDLVSTVFPNEADHIVLWLAQRVQRPHEKINHALVLGGAPGIGKDTILEPVKRAVGPWNFADVSPKQMLGRFNGFLKSIILRVNEARDLGEFDRYAFFDHMKAYIAAPPDVLLVDEKHLKEHYIPNLCGVVVTSNHKTDGIYLPADDRRHMVAWSSLTQEDFPGDYWRKIYGWYARGGDEHVAEYLTSVDLTEFDPKAPPPKTQAFWEIANANRAPEDAELADVLDDLGHPDIVTVDQVASRAGVLQPAFAEWLRDRKNRRSIPHRFEDCAYVAVSNPNDDTGRWKIDGTRHTLYGKAKFTVHDRLAAAFKYAGAR